ncbi:MAG: hypothetical protein ACJ74Y_03455, partial [Bryobacteraceae bacterium]
MSAYGQEDDDFAYEDEHIEIESDNQEYEDLEDGEFVKNPALLNVAIKSAATPSVPSTPKPSSVASMAGAKRVSPRQEISNPTVSQPARPVASSEPAVVSPRRPHRASGAKKSGTKQPRKVVSKQSTRGSDHKAGRPAKEAGTRSPAVKRTQPARKKALAKAPKKA